MKQQKQINKIITNIYKEVHEKQENKISCFSCKTPYCCTNKVKIDIIEDERTMLKKLITPEHKNEANKAFLQKSTTGQYNCPFLDKEGKCSIYHYRPLACSIYMVTSPSENCKNPLDHSAIVHPNFIFSHLPEKFLKSISKQKVYDLLEIFK